MTRDLCVEILNNPIKHAYVWILQRRLMDCDNAFFPRFFRQLVFEKREMFWWMEIVSGLLHCTMPFRMRTIWYVCFAIKYKSFVTYVKNKLISDKSEGFRAINQFSLFLAAALHIFVLPLHKNTSEDLM